MLRFMHQYAYFLCSYKRSNICSLRTSNPQVTLTSGGQDLTSKYTFDPRFGFSLMPTSSPQHLAYTSATCYLTDGSKTESLQFSVRSSKMASKLQSATIPVTLQAAEEVVEGLEDIVIDCKVELDAKLDKEVEVEWEVPALPFHRSS